MPRLSAVSWKKIEKFVLYTGCKFKRQKGDHRIYDRADLKRPVVIPQYDEVPVFIIKNNLRVLGVSPNAYLAIMQKLK